MSAHGPDFKLSDEFFAGIRTVATIDKAKGKTMSERTTQYYACKHGIPGGCRPCQIFEAQEKDEKATLLAQNRELVEALKRISEITREEGRGTEFGRIADAFPAKLGKGKAS